jgi:hypothetical protein
LFGVCRVTLRWSRPAKTRALLERTYFGRTIAEIWAEIREYFESKGQGALVAESEAATAPGFLLGSGPATIDRGRGNA